MRQAEVRIIKDSLYNGSRLTTFQIRYQRFIHSEFMTHRVFSRNASSSRAIPAAKIWKQIVEAPAMPFEWGLNNPGMQSKQLASPEIEAKAKEIWLNAAADAVKWSKELDALGLHKQIVNRVTEPFAFIQVVVTSSKWQNFFDLRNHPDADPSFHDLASMMLEAYKMHPVHIGKGEFHLPYINYDEYDKYSIKELVKFSVARCARVSYMLHDGTPTNPEKDLELYEKLGGGIPPHMSPFEHQARTWDTFEVGEDDQNMNGNLDKQWIQFRKSVEIGKPERFWRIE